MRSLVMSIPLMIISKRASAASKSSSSGSLSGCQSSTVSYVHKSSSQSVWSMVWCRVRSSNCFYFCTGCDFIFANGRSWTVFRRLFAGLSDSVFCILGSFVSSSYFVSSSDENSSQSSSSYSSFSCFISSRISCASRFPSMSSSWSSRWSKGSSSSSGLFSGWTIGLVVSIYTEICTLKAGVYRLSITELSSF
jgi:hypothetical protein